MIIAKEPNRIPHKFAFLRNDGFFVGRVMRRVDTLRWIPAFAGMTVMIALLFISACTQQEVVGSVKESIKGTCKAARNCTVYEPEGGAK
ncbi:MAG: hypothetical protein WC521_06020 [Bdellovibrionales bacterium]